MFNLHAQGVNGRSIKQISLVKEYSADAVFILDADYILSLKPKI